MRKIISVTAVLLVLALASLAQAGTTAPMQFVVTNVKNTKVLSVGIKCTATGRPYRGGGAVIVLPHAVPITKSGTFSATQKTVRGFWDDKGTIIVSGKFSRKTQQSKGIRVPSQVTFSAQVLAPVNAVGTPTGCDKESHTVTLRKT
jgi:uncharacterized protein (DUF1684 family)